MKDLDDAIASFLFHVEYEKRLSPKTLKAYTIDLKQMQGVLVQNNAPQQLESLDKNVLRIYIQWLMRYKPKTMKRKVAVAKSLFSYLEFEEVIAVSPFRKMRVRVKEPLQLPTALTRREIERLFQYVYSLRGEVENKSEFAYTAWKRDVAVLELLFATGVRVSELCALKPADLDLTTGLVKIIGKGQKERHIYIGSSEVKTALRTYRKSFTSYAGQGTFFVNRLGAPLSPQSVRFMIRRYAAAAQIGKHITPHTFRHTFATLLLEEDVDIKYIQSFLGHSSIMTTQIYTHVNRKKQKRILVNKHPRRRLQLSGFMDD